MWMLHFNTHTYLRFTEVKISYIFFSLFARHLQRVYCIRSTGINRRVLFEMNNKITKYILIFLTNHRHLLLGDSLTESVMKFTENFFIYTYFLYRTSQKCT